MCDPKFSIRFVIRAWLAVCLQEAVHLAYGCATEANVSLPSAQADNQEAVGLCEPLPLPGESVDRLKFYFYVFLTVLLKLPQTCRSHLSAYGVLDFRNASRDFYIYTNLYFPNQPINVFQINIKFREQTSENSLKCV